MIARSARRSRSAGRLAAALSQREKSVLTAALRKHAGNVSDCAAWLGVSRRALFDKLRLHRLDGYAGQLRAQAGIGGPRPKGVC